MSEIRVNSLGNETNTGGPVLSGITKFSGQQYFIPPTGTTAQRPSDCPPGSIRFNTDSAHLEYWNGLVWLEFEASSVELGNQLVTNSAGGTGVRGLIGGGFRSGNVDEIQYITISTLGNAQDFGNLTSARRGVGGCSSSTRGLFGGGMGPAVVDTIEFITIASIGNAQDFGDLLTPFRQKTGLSNSTRGLLAGGYNPSPAPTTWVNSIDYVTIVSTGNSQDFGDLSIAKAAMSACSSPIRGIFGGGYYPADTNSIEFITTSTLGNSQDFGDLTAAKSTLGSCSSSTRGVFGGGTTQPAMLNTIEFINISTLGNSQDFGDLTNTRSQVQACSNSIRGVWMGGVTPSESDVMDFVTISSTGNAIDFGDLLATNQQTAAFSNGHGGL